MTLPVLPARPTCTACALHEGVRSRGIPTRHLARSLPPSPTTPALLIVGQNPGAQEDKAAMCFVGPSGKLLERVYIGDLVNSQSVGPRLDTRATIYLGNAARCATWGTIEPAARHYAACSPFLLDDIAAILPTCSRLLLLLLGAPAINAVWRLLTGSGSSVKAALDHSARPLSTPHGPVEVHATYHPAYILRKQAMLSAVADHLSLLRDSLDGLIPTPSSPTLVPLRSPAHDPHHA